MENKSARKPVLEIKIDMNGPPNVELRYTSAPGPIPMKNGTYSSATTHRMPPDMSTKFLNQSRNAQPMPSR